MSRNRCIASFITLLLCSPAVGLAQGSPDEPGAPPPHEEGAAPAPAPAPPPPPPPPPAVVPAPAPALAPLGVQVTPMVQPPAINLLPVEIGARRTRVGTTFSYTSTDIFGGDLTLINWTIQGRMALGEYFEVGALLPALFSLSISDGTRSDSEVHMGNLRLDSKVRFAGSDSGKYAAAYFVQLTLPTLTADIDDRGLLGVQLRQGATLTGHLDKFIAGASVGSMHWIRWADGGNGDDLTLLDLAFYVGLQPIPAFSGFFALQVAKPIDPEDDAAVSFLVSLRVSPSGTFYGELCGRFAGNDEARFILGDLLSIGGKAQLILSAGYNFGS